MRGEWESGAILAIVRATIGRIFWRYTPVLPETIPAKAGISQCRVPQFAELSPFPRPPPKRRRRWRHVAMRFLPSQEWSTWGRGIVGGFWRLCVRQFCGFCGGGDNLANSAMDSRYPTGPFLRRQESILTMCRQRRRN